MTNNGNSNTRNNIQCPKIIPTKRFPSPNTAFPLEQLPKVKECIERANEVLRTLGNNLVPARFDTLRLHLRMLLGLEIRVELECNGEKIKETGVLLDAGKDFLVIKKGNTQYFMMYQRICSIEHQGESEFIPMEPELINIDDQLRKDLILHFGEVVSKNPDLINLFFGIPLFLQFQFLLGSMVTVHVVDGSIVKEVTGPLIDSRDGQIVVESVGNQRETIGINEICFVQME